jgi:hypothetical protein
LNAGAGAFEAGLANTGATVLQSNPVLIRTDTNFFMDNKEGIPSRSLSRKLEQFENN